MMEDTRSDHRPGNAKSSVDLATAPTMTEDECIYDRACRLFGERRYEEARRLSSSLDSDHVTPSLRATAINDLAVIDSLNDQDHIARAGFKYAPFIDPGWENAQRNLAMLESCPN